MNYDNKQTDKRLQELENQSLPDLSKMDEHWQQLNSLVQSGATVRKDIFRKRFWFALAGVAAIVIISFLVFRNQPLEHERSVTDTPVDTLPLKVSVTIDSTARKSDSVFFFRGRTPNGRDTLFEAVPLNKPDPKRRIILLERFYEQVQKKPQRFQLDNRRDTVIYGKEGTRLYIPANAFDTKEPVTVLLTEFYSIDDMIMNKLTTTSNGSRLVTGGMVYLDARDKVDELVDLKKGASLRLDIPKKDNQQPMRLFYGYDHYRNDVTTVMDSISWRTTDQVFTDAKTNPVESMTLSISKQKKELLIIEGDEDYNGEGARDTLPRRIKRDLPAAQTDSFMINRFGVNIYELGWINCDRFFSDPRPKRDLIVDLGDNPDNYYTVLVFDKPASVLRSSGKQGNTIRFTNIPEGETARIVSLGIKDDKPVTAMKKLIISRAPVNDLKFEEITASAFQKTLGQGNMK